MKDAIEYIKEAKKVAKLADDLNASGGVPTTIEEFLDNLIKDLEKKYENKKV